MLYVQNSNQNNITYVSTKVIPSDERGLDDNRKQVQKINRRNRQRQRPRKRCVRVCVYTRQSNKKTETKRREEKQADQIAQAPTSTLHPSLSIHHHSRSKSRTSYTLHPAISNPIRTHVLVLLHPSSPPSPRQHRRLLPTSHPGELFDTHDRTVARLPLPFTTATARRRRGGRAGAAPPAHRRGGRVWKDEVLGDRRWGRGRGEGIA